MKILYISTVFARPEESSSIYTDLAEALVENGHEVTVLAAEEKKKYKEPIGTSERGCKVFRIKIGNMYDVRIIEKGISIVTLPGLMKRGIKKYLSHKQFDLILSEAPPSTLESVIRYSKKYFHASAFLMMKDIFPQNALDIGMMKKGLVYYYFKYKEKRLYDVADHIGCMSKGNKKYIAEHSHIPLSKLSIFPNTKKIRAIPDTKVSYTLRTKYGIPIDRVVLVFGGNMGKPQGMKFLCQAIKNLENYKKAFFVLVGRGTERGYVQDTLKDCSNAVVLESLPRDEYERLVLECDVGIVSLDYRFTIPNYPSRILSYMEYGMPVLAATDKNTDFKDLLVDAKCGIWCHSKSLSAFSSAVKKLSEQSEARKMMGMNGRKYMERYFDVSVSVELLERYGNEKNS